MERLLNRARDLDCVFAYNDLLALGAIRTLRSRGGVPDDVCGVGFDNIDVASVVSPALTTIQVDRPRLGRMAIERLIGSDTGAEPEPMPVELIVREIELTGPETRHLDCESNETN